MRRVSIRTRSKPSPPAPDGLAYTFKLHQGIRFHDGAPLTAADVKATYDKIVFPPEGVRSIRKNAYTAIGSIEAPDPSTVVFKLKFPSASLLANLASPWNVIYPKKYLDKDPNYFKTNIVGSGPFKFKNYTRGSSFEGERNPDYFVKDRPYLDGYKFFISPETSVRAAALRSGRAFIEFRTMPGAEVDAIRKLRMLRTPSGGNTILSYVALTSAAVNGAPSWNRIPWWSLNV